ncbi:MAG TPA: lipid II flippase MurJ, partial [Gaiellaceae bacterium]
SAMCAVLAVPFVRLVYQRGAFHSDQTPVVAAVLAAFALGLTFNGTMLMLNRAFFSLQENWVPTMVALGNLGLNAVLDAALFKLGAWGIALATSLVNIAGSAALAYLLAKRLGSAELVAAGRSYAKIVVASALSAAVGFGVWWLVDHEVGRSLGGQLLSLLLAMLAVLDAYLFFCILLRIRELDALLSLRARRRRD